MSPSSRLRRRHPGVRVALGKRNSFGFGEVWESWDEAKIARFIGRHTEKDQEPIGIDAALDFPLFDRLNGVIKAGMAPASGRASSHNTLFSFPWWVRRTPNHQPPRFPSPSSRLSWRSLASRESIGRRQRRRLRLWRKVSPFRR